MKKIHHRLVASCITGSWLVAAGSVSFAAADPAPAPATDCSIQELEKQHTALERLKGQLQDFQQHKPDPADPQAVQKYRDELHVAIGQATGLKNYFQTCSAELQKQKNNSAPAK